MKPLKITSPSFLDGEKIPEEFAGKKGKSPALQVDDLSPSCQSIAIIMEQTDNPFHHPVVHWIIWNIPPMSFIPENIPHGPLVESLSNAQQGVALGVNRYRGPKKGLLSINEHQYAINVYALDTMLDLIFSAEKQHLIKAMEGHVLQQGSLTFTYKK
ncbi:MAG: YbhB/YbcL family Raf kinase inhibitor-like protein [Erysipelotrichaceae bacterium]|nr:YbhB/YbcL family Raf kinase inhibitor-like protein [Erysipelotrichaceae bacterium]